MSVRLTLAVLSAAAAIAPGAAQTNCQVAIAEFRDILATETAMGHVAPVRHVNAMAELARIDQTCRAGRNAEALRALAAVRARYGFR